MPRPQLGLSQEDGEILRKPEEGEMKTSPPEDEDAESWPGEGDFQHPSPQRISDLYGSGPRSFPL